MSDQCHRCCCRDTQPEPAPEHKQSDFEDKLEVEISPVNPLHYREHPSGVECIDITEHMNFNLGNAIKYIWRADLKGKPVEDLQKARFYIDREIKLRGGC